MFTAVSPSGAEFLHDDAAALWLRAPIRKRAERYLVWRGISQAMQVTLRERLFTAFAASPHAATPRETNALLVYCASEYCLGRSVTDVTCDLLNPRMMNTLFYKARRNLPALMERFREAMPADRRAAAARLPKPEAILTQVRGRRRLLERILATEGALVDTLMQFAEAVIEEHRPYAAMRDRLRRIWVFRLSKVYPGVSIPDFEADLFGAATVALERACRSLAESTATEPLSWRHPGSLPCRS